MSNTTSGSDQPQLGEPAGLNFGELASLIGHRWKLIVVSILLAAGCGLLLHSIITPQWQASIVLQIGRVSQKPSNDGLIESPDQLAARVNGRDFLAKVLARLSQDGRQGKNADEATLLKRTLKGTSVRNADFVQVNFSGFTQEQLKAVGAAIFDEVQVVHRAVYDSAQARLKGDLENVVRQYGEAESLRTRLEENLKALRDSSGERQMVGSVTLMNLLENNAQQLERLWRSRENLTRDLSPAVLYPTSSTAVLVDDYASFPKLGIFVGMGAVLGLIFGVLIALLSIRRAA